MPRVHTLHQPNNVRLNGGESTPTPNRRPAGGRIGLAPIDRSNANVSVPIGRSRKLPGGANELGKMPDGRALVLGKDGRFLVGGKKVATNGEALAIYRAAQIGSEADGLFGMLKLSRAGKETMLDRLTETLEGSLGRRTSEIAQKGFTGCMTLLLALAESATRAESDLADKAIKAALSGLERTKNPEHAAFYLLSFEGLTRKLSAAEKAQLDAVRQRVLPTRPLVEQYTDGRRKALEVRHTIHPDFWKEELAYFSPRNGFELITKNEKDTRRVYKATIEDPTGKKPPLKINLIVKKDELDYLETMSDPKAHVILYSGHSAVGGNGSQAIQAAGAMAGEYPKLVMAANCRGKDNYAEFTNKWPTAHCIMTENPTYSTSGQRRVAALFDTLARGESYAYMRKQSEVREWDEPATNYFYPDEMRKYRFMDADEDGRFDMGKVGVDRLFDVDANVSSGKFIRALNFANSELFYHWEVDAENGLRSHYGKAYADSLIPAGVLKDPKPGELIRVTELDTPRAQGKAFKVQYNVEMVKKMDQNVLGGHVTNHAILAMAKDRDGQIKHREELRAALMGAQGVHYLDVYYDSSPISFRRYFSDMGLTKKMEEHDIEQIFEKYDAHANDEQLDAFIAMLKGKYKVDTDAWRPTLKGVPVVV